MYASKILLTRIPLLCHCTLCRCSALLAWLLTVVGELGYCRSPIGSHAMQAHRRRRRLAAVHTTRHRDTPPAPPCRQVLGSPEVWPPLVLRF